MTTRERTPITAIGEMRISLSDRCFFFKPSFRNISEMGTPKEIVELYAAVNGADYVPVIREFSNLEFGARTVVSRIINKPVFGKKVLSAAFIIMQSCCEDDASALIGGWRASERGVRYVPGVMPVADIITIARELIEHGIIGKSPLKVPQRSENQSRTTNEFDVSEYISSARAHFSMSKDEAEDLTMTELQQMIKVKFPEPPGLTREQYDTVVEAAADDKAKMKQMMARRKNQRVNNG